MLRVGVRLADMDFEILYFLQELRTEFLDAAMVGVSASMFRGGMLLVASSFILMCFKRTRRCGIAVLAAYAMASLIGHFVLKELIGRARPCHLDLTVPLVDRCSKGFSCPSSHSCMAFSAATAIFWHYKKIGAALMAFASAIAFSRMYLFVHFPTDVLFGAILGILFGSVAAKLSNLGRTADES